MKLRFGIVLAKMAFYKSGLVECNEFRIRKENI